MKPFVPPRLPWPEITLEPLIPLIGQANRALAEFKGVVYGMLNSEVLLSPLTTQEAVLSSKIEGTQATFIEVLKFEAGDKPRSESVGEDIREILNYRRALWQAESALKKRPFNLNLLRQLHEILLDSVRGDDKGRGHFRMVQNWIGVDGTTIEQARFVPPPPHMIMELMDNWEKFYHADYADPIVQMALVHAQFEIIHPFLDGNGRLGRILVPLFLAEKELLGRPMFYLSRYLESNREAYVEHLRNLGRTPGSWLGWIEFFLRGVEQQARQNTQTARAILDLYQAKKEQAIKITHSQWAVPLVDRIFQHPVFTPATLQPWPAGPSKAMLAVLLDQFLKAKILKTTQKPKGRQPRVFAFPELINLCEGREVF
jgi:Fic family protein